MIMICRDVMTANPECCVAGDSITRAAEIMRRENVGPVPVVSAAGSRKLTGIITDRDIAIKVVAAGLDPGSTRVGDIMSREVVTCRVNDDYRDALQSMARHQVRRIPVLNDDGSLAGIIAQADVARDSGEEQVGEVVERISEPGGVGHTLGSLTSRFRGGAEQDNSMRAATFLLTGAGFLTVGAGMMYMLDPARGRARRAKLRDKATSLYTDSAYYAGKVQRDLQNRATGAVASAKSKLKHEEDLSDQKLEARVRSGLGRATSHPHAIRVRAENGCVTLEGNILTDELRAVLSSVRSVPGVREVNNNLQAHNESENIPDLQGGKQRTGQQFELMQSNWSPATRFLAGAVGGGLMIYGIRARGPVAKATATVAAGLLTRAIANKEVGSWTDVLRTRRTLA
jgi:CBS domain-containing protein/osmotically-inducible protein OsmY